MTDSFNGSDGVTPLVVLGGLNAMAPSAVRASDASDRSAISTASSVDFGTVEVREYERVAGDHV